MGTLLYPKTFAETANISNVRGEIVKELNTAKQSFRSIETKA